MLPSLPQTHTHLVLPALHWALEPYHPLLENCVKPAWHLRCRQVDTLSRTTTHIGGFTPYAPVERGWPSCPSCRNPLCFIWQINFADFEAATFAPGGLFQFFYCWQCFPLPGDPYLFDALCQWYPDFVSTQAATLPQIRCPYFDALPADQMELARPYQVELIPFLSVPSAISPQNPLFAQLQEKPLNEEGETFYQLYNETAGLFLRDCISQVSGYPNWVQDTDETPLCPVCHQQAELVGAIGSDETHLIWGDTGYWYLFACQATARCPGLSQPLMASQST